MSPHSDSPALDFVVLTLAIAIGVAGGILISTYVEWVALEYVARKELAHFQSQQEARQKRSAATKAAEGAYRAEIERCKPRPAYTPPRSMTECKKILGETIGPKHVRCTQGYWEEKSAC